MEPGRESHAAYRPHPPAHAARLSLLLALARVADLQAEVVSLREHRDRCEPAMLSLLREMLRLRACVQLQDSELKKLQQDLRRVARAPEKEALEVSCPPSPPTGGAPRPLWVPAVL